MHDSSSVQIILSGLSDVPIPSTYRFLYADRSDMEVLISLGDWKLGLPHKKMWENFSRPSQIQVKLVREGLLFYPHHIVTHLMRFLDDSLIAERLRVTDLMLNMPKLLFDILQGERRGSKGDLPLNGLKMDVRRRNFFLHGEIILTEEEKSPRIGEMVSPLSSSEVLSPDGRVEDNPSSQIEEFLGVNKQEENADKRTEAQRLTDDILEQIMSPRNKES